MSAPEGSTGRPWRRVFRLPASRRRAADDVAREIGFHLEQCEADLVARGLTPEAARVEARRRFGDPAVTAAECRTIEGGRQLHLQRRDWIQTLGQDIGYAVRTLRRAPAFTLAAALTLGVCLGGTTAMFSVVDSVLLRALPLPAPDRVVVLTPRLGGKELGGSPALLAAWEAESRGLQTIAGLRDRDATLAGAEGAERLAGVAVSGRYFDVLGLRPALGRAIGPSDDVPGAPAVLVLSHGLWTRDFGAANVLGRTVRFDGAPHTIIGVMPATADAVTGGGEFWVPLALDPSQRENFTPYLTLVGRLAPGTTPTALARELDAIVARLGPRAAEEGVFPTMSVELLNRRLADDYRRPLLLMLGAVAAVLLIGCANVATLVLARSVGRARELAVRASLGAGRGRLVRQLAAEHLLLGGLATVVALPVAAVAVRALVAAVPAEVPRLTGGGLDSRALAVAVILGIVTSLLCGVAPAFQLRRLDIRAALHGGGRGATTGAGERWRRTLVATEVALALVLLVGAGLLLRSAAALGRVRSGFDVQQVLTARLALPERDYPELAAAVRAYEEILAAVRRQPGVGSAALVSRVPLGGSMTTLDVALADRPFTRETKVNAGLRIASPDYFRSMGIALLAGRDLREADDARATPVVVVNATLARRLGGARGIVGRRIRSDNGAFAMANGEPRELEIVGVVGDVRDGGPRSTAQPEFYAPMEQVSEEPWNYWIARELVLVARTPGDPAAAAPALRRAVASVDPRVPLYDVQSTGERVRRSFAVERFSMQLLALLGAVGLGLAAVGIHAVVAYAVTQRTREVGVRLALGATPRHAVALVVRQGMRPVLVGLVTGAAAAVLAARAASGLLFGVSPLDPASLVAAAALLAVAGGAACYGPARRIARVDPADSLRSE